MDAEQVLLHGIPPRQEILPAISAAGSVPVAHPLYEADHLRSTAGIDQVSPRGSHRRGAPGSGNEKRGANQELAPRPRGRMPQCLSPRGHQDSTPGRAPVMIATAADMVCESGVTTATRRPRRWMWIRSATANTCGMLWLSRLSGT